MFLRGVLQDGLTLLELLIVVVIIGVLATFGISQYSAVRDRALSREAVIGLKSICSAQKIRQSEFNNYYGPTGDFSVINSNLRLELNERNWDYAITAVNNGVSPQQFTATATRQGGTCVYTISQAEVITVGAGCFSVD